MEEAKVDCQLQILFVDPLAFKRAQGHHYKKI